MHFSRLVRLGIPLILVAATASACGGTSSDALAKVKDAKEIIIGTSGNNAPTIFRDKSGALVGIDADWGNRVAKRLGVKVVWQTLDFQGIIPGLQANKFDAALSGLRVTPERAKVIDFSDSIGFDEAVVVFRQGMKGINSPTDIKGKSVCVVAGSSNGDTPVKRIGTAASVTRYPGTAEALQDLKNGRCQVTVTGRILAAYWIKSGPGKGFELSAKGSDGTPLAFGLPKGHATLLKAINDAIAAEKKGGAYEEVAQKWLGQPFSQ